MEVGYGAGDNQYAGMIHTLAIRIGCRADVATRIVGLHILQAELVLQVGLGGIRLGGSRYLLATYA